MEFQKIVNFLDATSDDKDLPKFVTKKWIESEGNYNINKEIRIKTSMLRSDLCDYSDAYIVVAPFINCISKINSVKIDNAEDLDIVMPCITYLNTIKIIEKQQVIHGIIIEMNQVIHFLLILNLLNTKQILYKKHQKKMIH